MHIKTNRTTSTPIDTPINVDGPDFLNEDLELIGYYAAQLRDTVNSLNYLHGAAYHAAVETINTLESLIDKTFIGSARRWYQSPAHGGRLFPEGISAYREQVNAQFENYRPETKL